MGERLHALHIAAEKGSISDLHGNYIKTYVVECEQKERVETYIFALHY